jgi:hypothetical protein
VGCGHGRAFKSGPAKPVAMVDSRSGLAGTGANSRVLKARRNQIDIGGVDLRCNDWGKGGKGME